MEVTLLSRQFGDFDLDVRFYPNPSGGASAGLLANTSPEVCNVPIVPTVIRCEPSPPNTEGPACVVPIVPTVAGHTCEQTCDPRICGVTNPAVCDTNTCNLGCQTQTCPDATCGCNTNETCNQNLCQGGGAITAPPCQDVSAADDTCDACQPQTGGCGGAETDNCVRTENCPG